MLPWNEKLAFSNFEIKNILFYLHTSSYRYRNKTLNQVLLWTTTPAIKMHFTRLLSNIAQSPMLDKFQARHSSRFMVFICLLGTFLVNTTGFSLIFMPSRWSTHFINISELNKEFHSWKKNLVFVSSWPFFSKSSKLPIFLRYTVNQEFKYPWRFKKNYSQFLVKYWNEI